MALTDKQRIEAALAEEVKALHSKLPAVKRWADAGHTFRIERVGEFPRMLLVLGIEALFQEWAARELRKKPKAKDETEVN